MNIKIRHNTDFPVKSPNKWEIIVDGVHHLVDAIEITCKCHTHDDYISCKAKTISFSIKKELKKATIS
jgi:hypothetical protein